MIFNNHSNLEGQHAFLGASKYHWIKLQRGQGGGSIFQIPRYAKRNRSSRICVPVYSSWAEIAEVSKTLNMYVNDAIGFKMIPEQILFYSENCFGTADTIMFRNRFLRIHDLKTGAIPAHMEQLKIYAALFCLEYKIKPADIDIELRLYQNNEILYDEPTAEDIVPIMDKIITFDKVIRKIKEQEG